MMLDPSRESVLQRLGGGESDQAIDTSLQQFAETFGAVIAEVYSWLVRSTDCLCACRGYCDGCIARLPTARLMGHTINRNDMPKRHAMALSRIYCQVLAVECKFAYGAICCRIHTRSISKTWCRPSLERCFVLMNR